ncbi:translation initiation factor eIF3 subunit [Coniophora puteana RWD-64-598 SS2]|uniref:Eukaryotic translation initiation factor 3 subunit J n=1 Tax=Coniophora puteana (strain RWD-64-598) TaxID=741705 RepID=A0A5M3MYL9_CONPW|nr:translation initiation factor eIF3 subunit [Coniophora puteana RWD-64-598 SS2]EIW84248.1 translation initiation factor eIF3 subunit [Coniophora puteana RWD-64-598 SS2]
MSDWENSSGDEAKAPAAAPAPAARRPPVKSKWENEDKEDSDPVSDWEKSSEEEEEDEQPVRAVTAAPPKKKGTIKQKIAEKEAARAARSAEDGDDDDDVYDEDLVLDPREKARLDKEREIKADLDNAASLFGSVAVTSSSSKDLDALLTADPRSKEDFQLFSSRIMEFIIKRHQDKPAYPMFVEHHAREIAQSLRDVEIRKAASGLTTLANEKQKEARDKASGKKKPKAKPALGVAKATKKIDTATYDDPLDDFGNNPDDFM